MPFFIAGYITHQPEPHRLYGFEIIQFPDSGVVLTEGRPPLRFELTLENNFRYYYGNRAGQGGKVCRYFDQNMTDPVLLNGGLAGSFLARSEHLVGLASLELSFHLDSPSVFPFIISPEVEAGYAKDGTLDEKRGVFNRPLESGFWYPIEISSVEIPYYWLVSHYPRPGIAAGVFRLSEPLKDGVGIATVRFVYEKPFWNPEATEFFLYRFGRPIGKARK